jgi:sulfide:quinone oxidoreductase
MCSSHPSVAVEAEPLHVVIAGGGVAGLEALIALRDLAGDPVRVTLVAPEPDFAYRALSVGEPFLATHTQRYPLARIAEDPTRSTR